MLSFTLGRLVSLCLSLVVASLVIFLVIEVIPGDPAAYMLGINAQPDTVLSLNAELGLDKPMSVRYITWVTGMMQGDFGQSYTYRAPVTQMVEDRILVSVPLAVYAIFLYIIIAFPAGIYAASRLGRAGDITVIGATQLGVAVPNFWFAIILVLIFAIKLRWFSAGGFPGWDKGFWLSIKSLSLPAVALALPQAAILARVMRSSLLDILGEDFIRTARAKGLNRRQVLWGHALRNASIPVLTIIGLQFSFLLAGGIIIEQVFFLPGLGRLIFQAISARDLVVVESVVMLLVFLVIIVNFAVDIAYVLVDPRLRKK